MAVRSWRGVAVGAGIAFALPMTYLLLGLLQERGIVDLARAGTWKALINELGLNVTAELVLAFAGMRIVGSAAGLRSPWAWLLLVVAALPVLALVWFVAYATLGGALGSPF